MGRNERLLGPLDIELIKSSLRKPSWFDTNDFKHHFKHVVEGLTDNVDDELLSTLLSHLFF